MLGTIWIGSSEFFRNQKLFHGYWEKHYASLGLIFPAKPLNGAIWMLWSLLFAICIAFLLKKITRHETIVISWLMGFVLLWLTIGNLPVLPLSLLWFAIPLSLIEVFVAVLIMGGNKTKAKNSGQVG